LTAVIYLVGGSLCLVLIEGTTQPWAEAEIKSTQIEQAQDKVKAEQSSQETRF